MSGPLVSVLIPCYNAEAYIGETLDSVYRQTWKNIEIVIVDDGSRDNSAGVVQGMARDNLKLIRQENRGQTAALNSCLLHATGDFIQYLDADDLIDPEKIETQLVRLLEQPACVASAEWGRFYADPSDVAFHAEDVWRDLDPIDWLAISRIDGDEMMMPGLWLIPAAIVQKAGPWREELSLNNDAEYFTRILLAAELVLFCPGARVRYRSGLTGSLSRQKSPAALLSQYSVLDLCEGYVRAREDSDRIRKGFSICWQHFAQACYPYDSKLSHRALDRARALHAINVIPSGGSLFVAVSRVIGWRLARKLQLAVKARG